MMGVSFYKMLAFVFFQIFLAVLYIGQCPRKKGIIEIRTRSTLP